jgi:hypothetical protein
MEILNAISYWIGGMIGIFVKLFLPIIFFCSLFFLLTYIFYKIMGWKVGTIRNGGDSQ